VAKHILLFVCKCGTWRTLHWSQWMIERMERLITGDCVWWDWVYLLQMTQFIFSDALTWKQHVRYTKVWKMYKSYHLLHHNMITISKVDLEYVQFIIHHSIHQTFLTFFIPPLFFFYVFCGWTAEGLLRGMIHVIQNKCCVNLLKIVLFILLQLNYTYSSLTINLFFNCFHTTIQNLVNWYF